MLNPKLKLNPKIWNADVEQVPIRKGFGQGLLKAGEENENVVAEFLKTNSAFTLEFERFLLPFADATDGAYVARLVRH